MFSPLSVVPAYEQSTMIIPHFAVFVKTLGRKRALLGAISGQIDTTKCSISTTTLPIAPIALSLYLHPFPAAVAEQGNHQQSAEA
jgi:hypothetical protein